MQISRTFYNASGELMAPRSIDILLGSVTPGGMPSVEAGFYHRFKFEGRTPDERQAKLDRFIALMGDVPGFMALTSREYTVRMGSYVRHGLDIVYVVESAEQRAIAARMAQRTVVTV